MEEARAARARAARAVGHDVDQATRREQGMQHVRKVHTDEAVLPSHLIAL